MYIRNMYTWLKMVHNNQAQWLEEGWVFSLSSVQFDWKKKKNQGGIRLIKVELWFLSATAHRIFLSIWLNLMSHITLQHKKRRKEQKEKRWWCFSTAITARKKLYCSIKSRKHIHSNHKIGSRECFFSVQILQEKVINLLN